MSSTRDGTYFHYCVPAVQTTPFSAHVWRLDNAKSINESPSFWFLDSPPPPAAAKTMRPPPEKACGKSRPRMRSTVVRLPRKPIAVRRGHLTGVALVAVVAPRRRAKFNGGDFELRSGPGLCHWSNVLHWHNLHFYPTTYKRVFVNESYLLTHGSCPLAFEPPLNDKFWFTNTAFLHQLLIEKIRNLKQSHNYQAHTLLRRAFWIRFFSISIPHNITDINLLFTYIQISIYIPNIHSCTLDYITTVIIL